MLLPHRVKVSRHKNNTFHTILPVVLCTCLYRSHLRKPVLMKQKRYTAVKSEAQNLCSKCPLFMQTHAFKPLRHCTIAAVMMV